ncbi:DUF1846 domain-containing protein [Candidatus Woesearchaeota archaeon]|nr:DUF1846 domain-containing protein [Candidatus Woesearchaeota archaeon]
MRKAGFDTKRYLERQTKEIIGRVGRFEKLYLEFGGKLCYDLHAARVLPGYKPTTKIELLKKLGPLEIIYCISAKDIERGRVRRDFGLTYDNQALKDINDIKEFGLKVSSVIITRFSGEHSASVFKKKLESFGMKAFIHNEIGGYPDDIEKVLAGYGKQPYVKTDKNLVIVTGVGGNSGKMAFCLSQIYHERKKGRKTGFAKFETFPIWNIALDHPVNAAYEAATADLLDLNMVDPLHKQAYGIDAVNYNRDIENFNILRNIMQKITHEKDPFGYRSPTDMGVNMAKEGIIDDDACREAAKQEIRRRYFRYYREKIEGIETQKTLDRIQGIMKKVRIKADDRKVAIAAREAALESEKKGKGFNSIFCGASIELEDGKIVKGKNSPLLHAESAAILNAVKELAGVPDKTHLISKEIIEAITGMKRDLLGKKTSCLNVEETLIALAMSSISDIKAKKAMEKLKELKNCEMHITHLPTPGDEAGLIRLNMNVTTDAKLSLLPYFQ